MSNPDTATPSLAEQTEQAKNAFIASLDADTQQLVGDAFERLLSSDVGDGAIQVGDRAPAFSLPNAQGREVALYDALAAGPVVLNFYRGGWCPFCNLELSALQRRLPEFEALGAQLIGVSPETPDTSLSTIERSQLGFEVLSDQGNRIATLYGLLMEVDATLRPMYLAAGFDLPAFNGDPSWQLPLPATYVIAGDGRVVAAFVDKDYTHRMEPDAIVDALRGL